MSRWISKYRPYPADRAGILEMRMRRWIQDPRKLLKPYIQQGMTVLDIGCGPGFFSIDMAHMVGKAGRVIAADLQEGMLQKLRTKIQGTELAERITLHRCEAARIGVSEKVDFALAFYVVHEIPDQKAFFEELTSIVKPEGQALIVEPPFGVSRAAFEETIRKAGDAGFTPTGGPRIFLSKTAILKNG